MAISVGVSHSSDNFSTDSYTTASFTPPNNCLLVVIVNCESKPGNVATDLTISGGSLTWTRQVAILATTGDFPTASVIFTAPVSTGASMTLTFNDTAGLNPSSGKAIYICAYNVTGYDTGTPIGATGTSTALGDGAVSFTMSGAAASTSAVFSATCAETNGGGLSSPSTQAGSGWTLDYSPASDLSCGFEHIIGLSSSTIPWQTAVIGGGGAYSNSQVFTAIEVKAAAAASASFPAFKKPTRFFNRRF